MENYSGTNEEVERLSLGKRIIGVIFSPIATMKNIAQKPDVAAPIIWTALGTLLLYLSRYSLYVDYTKEVMVKSLAAKHQTLTPGMIDAAVNMYAKLGVAIVPITTVITILIMALVLWLLSKIFGGTGRYKQFVSVTGYAYIITLIYTILTFAASFYTQSIILNTSLALLFQGMKGSYLYGILRGIDPFSIWYFIVLAFGVSEAGKISKGKAFTVTGLVYIVTLLIGMSSNRLM